MQKPGRYGYQQKPVRSRKGEIHRDWTPQEDAFLQKNYYRGLKYLAKTLRRSEDAVRFRGYRFGLGKEK